MAVMREGTAAVPTGIATGVAVLQAGAPFIPTLAPVVRNRVALISTEAAVVRTRAALTATSVAWKPTLVALTANPAWVDGRKGLPSG